MSRRLLLSVAGLTLLSAEACGAPVPNTGSAEHHADSPGPLPPTSTSPTPTPAKSPSPSPAAPAVNVPSPALSSAAAPSHRISDPLFSLPSDDKLVALTIDDGPDPTHTPIVLSILKQHGIRATFFLVGENAAAHPGLVREIAQQGHHVANHTWTHPDLRQLPDAQVRDELERTSDVLQKATGKPPTWFRSPGGDWCKVALRTCSELGMRPMGWSVDPRDWSRPGTSKITTRVLGAVRPGSIVLNHDGGGDRSQTIAAMRAYLPVLIEDGYQFTAPR
ncbi:polysaccharide deacetylase family protein [Kitasatospora sp. MAP5-34]|uniref:polysaccharide deacetylase family protein n=1 Tax=Kitasatospora sp. MAP5-34 TaxID=3035102 RepID=UPI0024750D49|nr:polysaccharide deacetylase family protein [Kitasatospora sp. MAP5-34]